jgi:GNAT superfamily N-acetyltransferase
MTQLDVRGVARVERGLNDVRIRPYNLTDRDRLRRIGLSPVSLYLRFFSGTPRIPEYYVQALHHMDHWDHDAMVAILDDEIIGIAEYVRDRHDRARAEVAVLITDAWQRHGLARPLITFLAQLAERRGITEFDADVMLQNRGGLSAVRSGWPSARAVHTGDSAHFRLPLPVPPPAPHVLPRDSG